MALSGGVRLVLILCAIAAGGVILMAAGGWYWWTHHSREFFESGRAVMDEGRAAGRKLDEGACLALAVDRHRKDAGAMGTAVRNNLWLTGCLEASRPQRQFCEGVPPYDSPVAVGAWAGLACARQGLSDSFCSNLYSNVAKYCSSPRRKARMAGQQGG